MRSFLTSPEVYAALRPPATVWQPSGLRDAPHPSKGGCFCPSQIQITRTQFTNDVRSRHPTRCSSLENAFGSGLDDHCCHSRSAERKSFVESPGYRTRSRVTPGEYSAATRSAIRREASG